MTPKKPRASGKTLCSVPPSDKDLATIDPLAGSSQIVDALLERAPGVFALARASSGLAAVVLRSIQDQGLFKVAGHPSMWSYASSQGFTEAGFKKTARAGAALLAHYPDLCRSALDDLRQGRPLTGVTPPLPNEAVASVLSRTLKRVGEDRREVLLQQFLEGKYRVTDLEQLARPQKVDCPNTSVPAVDVPPNVVAALKTLEHFLSQGAGPVDLGVIEPVAAKLASLTRRAAVFLKPERLGLVERAGFRNGQVVLRSTGLTAPEAEREPDSATPGVAVDEGEAVS